MPICEIVLSDAIADGLKQDQLNVVRDVVAEELTSGARFLDRNHIVLRVQRSTREYMLGDMELEVRAQFFLRRFFSRDRRAERISRRLSLAFGWDCATWINMSVVGYSRVTRGGEAFFSD